MAAPVYPGDVVNGDAMDATYLNDRWRPLWAIANPGISGGTGVTDDQVNAGVLSADRISGVAMTLDANETATGDKIFGGDTTVGRGAMFLLDVTAVREFGTNSGGANGGSATNDTTPDCVDILSLVFEYSAPTSVTLLDNPTEGQVIHIIVLDSTVTFNHNTGGTGSMLNRSIGNVAVAGGSGIMYIARDDGSATIKWWEGHVDSVARSMSYQSVLA